jgi:hypothetical protein
LFVAEKLTVTLPPGGAVDGEIDSVTEMLTFRTAAVDGPASRSIAKIASSLGIWRKLRMGSWRPSQTALTVR